MKRRERRAPAPAGAIGLTGSLHPLIVRLVDGKVHYRLTLKRDTSRTPSQTEFLKNLKAAGSKPGHPETKTSIRFNTVHQVKIFKGVESELNVLEQQVNQWLAEQSVRVVQMIGNIAPQSHPKEAGAGMLSKSLHPPSDVLIVLLYEKL